MHASGVGHPQSTPQILAGHYVVVRSLAGGMGIVHICTDSRDADRPVAVKTFKPEYLSDIQARRRFLQEASVWVGLGFHPNIVQALGAERDGQDGAIYLVLELVPTPQGMSDPSLRSWLRRFRGLPVPRIMEMALGIARGMRYACSRVPSLVHRDLKPENILLGPDRTPRITDFGLVAIRPESGRGEHPLSAPLDSMHTAGAVGTPLYMSPEQWQGASTDARSDIYSFGLILMEMVAGYPVLAASRAEEIAVAHMQGRALALARQLDVPRGLRAFMESLVHPVRDSRVPSWEAVSGGFLQLWGEILHREPPPDNAPVDVSALAIIRQGESLQAIGGAHLDIGELGQAESFFRRAIEIAQQQRYPPLFLTSLANLAVSQAEQGNYAGAIPLYQEAIAGFRSLGLDYYVAHNAGNLGNAHFAMRQFDQAWALLSEALSAARASQDRASEARWLGDLGNVAAAQGDLEAAHTCFRDSFDVAEASALPESMATALAGLALVKELRGRPEQALELYARASRLAEEHADRRTLTVTTAGIGSAHLRMGSIPSAIASLSKAINLARETGNRWLEVTAMGNLGSARIVAGDTRQALEDLTATIQLADAIGAKDVSARAKWGRGIAFLGAGDTRAGLVALEQALGEYKALSMPEYENAVSRLEQLRRDLGDRVR